MKVKQLIEMLKQFNQEYEVILFNDTVPYQIDRVVVDCDPRGNGELSHIVISQINE